MDAIKRTLLSLILVCLSPFSGFAKEKTEQKKYYPETLQEHINLFDEKFSETGERNERLFKDLEVQNIISNYIYFTPTGYKQIDESFYPTEKERDKAKEHTMNFLEDTGKEFRYSLGWIDEIEEEIKDSTKDFFDSALSGSQKDFPWLYAAIDSFNDIFRYGFSFKGKEADGDTYSPTLNEEKRLEDRERMERTGAEFVIPEFGRKYLLDIDFGYKPRGWDIKELFGGFETGVMLRNFQILGHKFNKAKLECRTDQKAKASLTKLIGDSWYYELSSKFETFPEFETVSLTFVRETILERTEFGFVESLPSRLRLSVSYDNRENRVNKYVCSVDYVLRF